MSDFISTFFNVIHKGYVMFRSHFFVALVAFSFSYCLQASFAPQSSAVFDTSRFQKENRTKQQKAADAFAQSIMRGYQKCLKDAGNHDQSKRICDLQLSNFSVIIQKK